MKPAVKLRSGGIMAGTCWRDGIRAFIFDMFRSTSPATSAHSRASGNPTAGCFKLVCGTGPPQRGPRGDERIEARAPSRLEPACEPSHRLVDLRRCPRVAETDEVSALVRIEIDARRRRHVRLHQHLLGEFEAVVAE